MAGARTGGSLLPACPVGCLSPVLSSFERRLAAIGAFGDRLIAPSAFYEVKGAWIGTFS